MPKPRQGESKNDFMHRCVPMVMDEGYSQDAAVARCMGIWNSKKRQEYVEKFKLGKKDGATKE